MSHLPISPRAAPILVAPTTLEYNAVRQSIRKEIDQGVVRLAQSGMGVKNAEAFCKKLDPVSCSQLILIGWAGGLAEDLKAGDVICATDVLMEARQQIKIQPLLLMRFQPGLVRQCPSLTVARPLNTSAEKIAARETGAVAVEMEAYPMAAWAQTHGIAFTHLRVILDAWDEPLPQSDSQAGKSFNEKIRQIASFPKTIGRLAWLFQRIQELNPILGQLAASAVREIT